MRRIIIISDIDEVALRRLLDTFIPADDYPSAVEAGALTFLDRALLERPAWKSRITGALAGDSADLAWLARLTQVGYYADPARGGNRDAASWRMIDWRRGPVGWPPAPIGEPTDAPTSALADVDSAYDAVVIGSGAGGGTAAAVLAQAGLRVLVVERGDASSAGELIGDHLHNPRVNLGFQDRTLPRDEDEPRIVSGRRTVPSELQWGANAMTLGGGTRVYGAQAWRFDPTDFRMGSRYGIPEGSSLADWPIDYDELEPWYATAENAFGVSGEPDPRGGHRSQPFPMRPLPPTRPGRVLSAGAALLGWETLPVPLAVNSVPYLGRPACARCAECVGFACPIGAKAGSQNTVLSTAIQSGRATIATLTRATRIRTDSTGRVDGVELVDEATLETRSVAAALVVVSAGAVETARLLLASANAKEPEGLGNRFGQVGKNLQGHLYSGALGVFEEELNDLVGPGPQIATTRFRHNNEGLIGGGMLANEFVPTPVSTFAMLRDAGLIPPWGIAAKNGMRRLAARVHRIIGPVQEVPNPQSRVDIDWSKRDRAGMPIVRLSGSNRPEDRRMQAFLSERAEEWLRASGAREVVAWSARPKDWGPSVGQHQAGTVRMGSDPMTSAADPFGRIWGHENLLVADTSLHVTNGGVNPVLTAIALAFRNVSHAASVQ